MNRRQHSTASLQTVNDHASLVGFVDIKQIVIVSQRNASAQICWRLESCLWDILMDLWFEEASMAQEVGFGRYCGWFSYHFAVFGSGMPVIPVYTHCREALLCVNNGEDTYSQLLPSSYAAVISLGWTGQLQGRNLL